MTRQSIRLRQTLSEEEMDHRVKPGDDEKICSE
jgi:hypothetical protein